MKTHAFRLKNGQKLREEIDSFVISNKIQAGAILTCVGSLEKATLRMPGAKETKILIEDLEIISLAGTLSQDGNHLHLSVSDKTGRVFGGHLKNDSVVRTSAEIVITEFEDLLFMRELDLETGYDELKIENR